MNTQEMKVVQQRVEIGADLRGKRLVAVTLDYDDMKALMNLGPGERERYLQMLMNALVPTP